MAERYYEDHPGGGRVSKTYDWRPINPDRTYGPGGVIKWVAWGPDGSLLGVFGHDEIREARLAVRDAEKAQRDVQR